MSGKSTSKRSLGLRSEVGLTLTETFVTMAILSMIIVLSLALIIYIGRIYNRGIQTNQLQDATNKITSHISETIRTSGVKVERFEDPTWAALTDDNPDNDWFGYCIGDTQYSYRLNTQLVADGGKTKPQPPNQADQAFIVTELCNTTGITDANPDHTGLKDFDTDPNTPLIIDRPEKFELLHDRMRVLGFSVDQVGNHEDLYDIRLKLAVGGDAMEPLYEVEIFEFIEHPCRPPALARWNLGLVFDEAACRDASNEWERVLSGTPIVGAGTWSDPATLSPKGEDDLPHYNSAIPPTTIEDRNVIINKCKRAATLCAVMETRTRVFRRVF